MCIRLFTTFFTVNTKWLLLQTSKGKRKVANPDDEVDHVLPPDDKIKPGDSGNYYLLIAIVMLGFLTCIAVEIYNDESLVGWGEFQETVEKVHENELLDDEMYILITGLEHDGTQHPVYSYSIENESFVVWRVDHLQLRYD